MICNELSTQKDAQGAFIKVCVYFLQCLKLAYCCFGYFCGPWIRGEIRMSERHITIDVSKTLMETFP